MLELHPKQLQRQRIEYLLVVADIAWLALSPPREERVGERRPREYGLRALNPRTFVSSTTG